MTAMDEKEKQIKTGGEDAMGRAWFGPAAVGTVCNLCDESWQKAQRAEMPRGQYVGTIPSLSPSLVHFTATTISGISLHLLLECIINISNWLPSLN